MFHRDHRHNHQAPVGLILLKIGAGLLGAVIKKKINDRLTGHPKRPPDPGDSHSRLRRGDGVGSSRLAHA